jgi:hypothetical protein
LPKIAAQRHPEGTFEIENPEVRVHHEEPCHGLLLIFALASPRGLQPRTVCRYSCKTTDPVPRPVVRTCKEVG